MRFIYAKFFLIICSLLACEDKVQNPTPPIVNNSGTIKVIQDEFQGRALVIAGSKASNFIVSFESVLDGDSLMFEALSGSFPIVMQDTEGTKWNIFGEGVDGPRSGAQLISTQATMSYWFALPAFFEQIELYNDPDGSIVSTFPDGTEEWAIPIDYIFQGAGKDAILALIDPDFLTFRAGDENGFYLDDEDLIIGVKIGDQIRAYPHKILDWHEIVNDAIGSTAFALNYCPLTGTGFAWTRTLEGQITTFGVSGLLYNSNLIPYDRLTQSYWSQIKNQCVNGALKDKHTEGFALVETTWATWKDMFDRPIVLTDETGSSRDYQQYPYGTYKVDNNVLYPMINEDSRLPRKERVHAVITGNKVKVYRFDSF
ncbi:MAG: DUF3179 domain-containing protein [Cyclobacteriaceae bacterium]|nr:DUF3179 domain-containing protein [Cyclobacteriaceae bacterium]